MASSIVAIDVAILPPDHVAAAARAINVVLAGDRGDALRLDDTHRPHVTLAQQFVERARLDELYAVLDRILRHQPPLSLRVTGTTTDRDTAFLVIETTPDLQGLHEAVMDAIEPFESPDATAGAFQANGETIRARDVDWVANYREVSAYTHFRPHVTLGHGPCPPLPEPLPFRAEDLAVCHLGRFCTCRDVFRRWGLGKD